MIDCVFLMLVYFMTTSSLERSEADLPCPVGQAGIASDPLPAVDEQSLVLTGTGDVLWNGSSFSLLETEDGRGALLERLLAFASTCQLASSDPSLRINPEAKTPVQALVSLLDTIQETGIERIYFP